MSREVMPFAWYDQTSNCFFKDKDDAPACAQIWPLYLQLDNKCNRCGEVNPAEIHTCSPIKPVSDFYQLEVVAYADPEDLEQDGYGHGFFVSQSDSGVTDMVPLYIKKR